ncbi:hypothetical protein IFR05_005349 [Cadophora sp. M221]|nr:hypothetical protein IFR05_005349 [Cadophora sp. M221]
MLGKRLCVIRHTVGVKSFGDALAVLPPPAYRTSIPVQGGRATYFSTKSSNYAA